MTKKEREHIDYTINNISENIEYLKGYNISVSRLARLYEKSGKLNKEEGNTFEKVCIQIEETLHDLDKTIDRLSYYGTTL